MAEKAREGSRKVGDNDIIKWLLEDPTRSLNDMAKSLNVYRQTLWRRKKKLEEEAEEFEPEEVYENGKKEMMQTMIEYGETLTFLGDEDYLVVAAFMEKLDFWKDKDRPSRMILKAKMKDLREAGAERISEDAAMSRISVEEY